MVRFFLVFFADFDFLRNCSTVVKNFFSIMTYKQGVFDAIHSLNSRSGVSMIAIKKAMQAKLPTVRYEALNQTKPKWS